MRDIIHDPTTGHIVGRIRTGYGEAALDVGWVRPKLPTAYGMPLQPVMTTVRNNGGPDSGPLSLRRYGFLVYDTDPVAAEARALRLMAILRTLADGKPIVAVDQVNGPAEVDDSEPDIVAVINGKPTHAYLVTARISVRPTNA